MLKKEKVKFIIDELNRLYPKTPIPLDHKNNFELLIAVLLSAQCTDERVNQVTPKLFNVANTPLRMSKISRENIYSIIKPCGLGPQKSKAISELSNILIEQLDVIIKGLDVDLSDEVMGTPLKLLLKHFQKPQ